MAATPEQFGANLAKGISQMGKKAGVDWRGAIRGDKKANANPADAHGSSYVPLVGGAISAAVKPHPSRGMLTNVLGEGWAGLKGGTIGSMIGGGAGAVTDLATKFKGRGVPTLLGALLGGAAGTHVGSQLHRESIPLNARALAELTSKKSAAEKTAILDGALIGGALGGASAPRGHMAENIGRGMVRGVGTEIGAGLGAVGGGVAGGAAGAAGGAGLGALAALLSKNHRGELGRLAMGGLFAGGATGAGIGGLAGLYHGGRAGYNAAGKFMGPASYAKQAGDKRASLPEGLLASVPGAVSGGTAGLGVGALYGLLSGALQARKGKKLRGALGGALRGAGGGGLIGAGIGGGLGLGTGLMMPNVFTTNPTQQAANALSIASNPIGHASKMTAGALVGGIGGGYLGNKARKKLIGDKNEEDAEEDEGLETEDKTEISPALKSAAFVPSPFHATPNMLNTRGRLLNDLQSLVTDRIPYGILNQRPGMPAQITATQRAAYNGAGGNKLLGGLLNQLKGTHQKLKDVGLITGGAERNPAVTRFI